MSRDGLERRFDAAHAVAREAGALARHHYDNRAKLTVEVKGVQDTTEIVGTLLTFRLEAGPNVGQEIVAMKEKRNHLEFKRRPKVDCCGDDHDGDDDSNDDDSDDD